MSNQCADLFSQMGGTFVRQIDVKELIGKARFSSFHGRLLFWCALVIIFDGYDLAVVGVALPTMMAELNIGGTMAGLMASSALFGMMFGNVVFGALAEQFGRRRTIIFCVAVFSVFTAAAGLAQDALSFSLLRFIAGLGIGGVMPNVIALMTEYSPLRLRSTLVSVMFSGYTIGGILAAVTGKSFIETYGWQSVFIAAAVPVLLIPMIWRGLPESAAFLKRKRRYQELQGILERISPAYSPRVDDDLLIPVTNRSSAASFRMLFTEGRGFSTAMFGATCFLSLFMVYALSTWLTALLKEAGHNLGSALTFVSILNLGAIAGAVGGGWLADRFRINVVLALMYLMAAAVIPAMGLGLPDDALYLVVAFAGAATIGTQIVTSAYAAQFYSEEIRSMGVGLLGDFAT